MAPIYDYKAISTAGKASKGLVEAENQKAARQKLKKQGLMVTDISERTLAKQAAQGSSVPFMSGKASGKDIAMMTRQLASLIKANIPLVDALSAMMDQAEVPSLKVTLSQVRQDVNEGSSLAKSLAKHPKVFDGIFINMVEAGESSGTLGLVLLKLADMKEAQMRLKSKITSGMMYPALMMGVAVILMIGIFAFVIPQMTKIFQSMNKPMPPITLFLMGVSDILLTYWYVFLGAFVAAVVTFQRFLASPEGKAKWDAFTLKTPIFGPLIRMVAVTRFSSTMATLLGSGVPILTAMNIAKNLVANGPISKAIQNARENITEGQSIADPLRRSGEFPPMVIHMIAIGEKTGELPDMLKNVADTYEEQVNTKIEGMTSLLEPLMIIGMGGMVGFIVLSVMIPLLDMSNLKK
ncbi:MAG: type II secretion system inner membrane protein GspF [Bdellovibrionales bacterium]|nr:type II secretion system inner membrane protein GspF [Bdellovibrionales bacterium]